MSLLNKKVDPPFVPTVAEDGDTSQFDTYEEIKMEISKNCKYEEDFAEF